MNTLVNKLITTKCELLVSPKDSITEDDSVVYLEFVVGDKVDCYDNALISSVPDSYRYKMDDDGLFMYYRLKIYTKTTLGTSCAGKLYYDDINDKLMLGDEEINSSDKLEEIVDDIKSEYAILDIIEEPVFSICRLNHCLTEYQRRFVLEGCKNGFAQKCNNDPYESFAREFLFSTAFVLRQLIRQQRFEEALAVLKSVEGCNGLCADTKSASKTCNCCK